MRETEDIADLLVATVLGEAKMQEAVYPTIGESTSGVAVIVDTDSGRVWEIVLKELKSGLLRRGR